MFHKMATSGHFGCPNITFDCISGIYCTVLLFHIIAHTCLTVSFSVSVIVCWALDVVSYISENHYLDTELATTDNNSFKGYCGTFYLL